MSATPLKPLHYACVLFEGFQLLDAAGPLDILASLPNIKVTILAETLEHVSTKSKRSTVPHPAFAVYVKPDQDYGSFLASNEHVDVLIVPGGIGTRDPDDACDATREFISQITSRVTTAIITVCTGSDLLASTGLLDDQSVRATTNMTRFEMVRTKNAHRGIEWLNKVRWVKSSIKGPKPLEIWTSAGITAGMDVMFAFVAEKYGREEALKVVKRLEVQWRELGSGEHDSLYDDYP
jgi:transcriptional regulator GlxA family with amidase domain